MTDLSTRTRPTADRTAGLATAAALSVMHEALARSRQREAEEEARRYRLSRSLTAGRMWGRLARYAASRAERARAGSG